MHTINRVLEGDLNFKCGEIPKSYKISKSQITAAPLNFRQHALCISCRRQHILSLQSLVETEEFSLNRDPPYIEYSASALS